MARDHGAVPVEPLHITHGPLMRHAAYLLRSRKPALPEHESVAAELVLAADGQPTPSGEPSAEWLEVARLAAAPSQQAERAVPAREHTLEEVRCGCCGYMTYHREHLGCIRAAAPVQQAAPTQTDDPGPILDDDGRAMIANSHHYTADNIRALVDEYKALEANAPGSWLKHHNTDHCARAGVLWRVISALADEVPLQQAAPAGDAVDADSDDSLLLCASDLQHSAIYDNHVEMQACIRAVADRIKALAATAQQAAKKERRWVMVGIFFTNATGKALDEQVSAMDKATQEWTMRAARGECSWVCADCCCTFADGMPDACEHGHQACTDIIERDKADAAIASQQP